MNAFDTLKQVIEGRRTTKPAQMNGQKISDEDVKEILALADWAPTHARTEPWRFFVLTGDNLQKFCEHHADLYWANTSPETRTETKRDALLNMGSKASHLVISLMRRTPEAKIITEEEYAAVAAATQNILLGATAKGIASFWSTGGMTHHPAMKLYLELKDEDLLMGLLYLGYSDEQKEGMRKIPLDDKIIWV
ncbi:nitroreductase family protein [Edaphocola aurantiacus]|uniref:nitroreductase family protein n=1 Tax=Edaphocola aurantiacus TaxID=2601682 RepID=UPI001C950A9F|nr:nitroreductase family protein [Edaphocola aurantiacus]